MARPAEILSNDFVDRLVSAIGSDRVLTSLEDRRFFSLDFSEQPGETPLAVVRPRDADDVVSIVKLAADAGVAVNTRGGGMSYTRGHVPTRSDTVIVDATGLNRIIEINRQDRYMVLETGVTWAEVRAALRGTGLRVPYLGTFSGNYATVGGGLSQNATGMGRVTLAEHVLGLEVVLGNGKVLRTGSWSAKNTAPFYRYFGPDLTGMFLCDSGAFGIKTKVVLLLEPWPKAAFGCATFPSRVQFVAAQAEIAQSGLQTECFALDGHFASGYAERPTPPLDEKRRMVREFWSDNPDKLRALRALLKAWHPKGLGFLKGLPNVVYYITEAFDQKAADRMVAALNKIVKKHGGRLLPTTIPFGTRYGPFVDVGELVITSTGEVNFPMNAKFPASKATEVMQAYEAFVADNQAMLDRYGIRLGCNALLHGHFWGIEPVMFWKRPLGLYRGHYAPESRKAITASIQENPDATAAAIDFRYRLTRMFRSMGSLHVQWAKSYPFAEALEGQAAWELLTAIKNATDPDRIINPGLLGLD